MSDRSNDRVSTNHPILEGALATTLVISGLAFIVVWTGILFFRWDVHALALALGVATIVSWIGGCVLDQSISRNDRAVIVICVIVVLCPTLVSAHRVGLLPKAVGDPVGRVSEPVIGWTNLMSGAVADKTTELWAGVKGWAKEKADVAKKATGSPPSSTSSNAAPVTTEARKVSPADVLPAVQAASRGARVEARRLALDEAKRAVSLFNEHAKPLVQYTKGGRRRNVRRLRNRRTTSLAVRTDLTLEIKSEQERDGRNDTVSVSETTSCIALHDVGTVTGGTIPGRHDDRQEWPEHRVISIETVANRAQMRFTRQREKGKRKRDGRIVFNVSDSSEFSGFTKGSRIRAVLGDDASGGSIADRIAAHLQKAADSARASLSREAKADRVRKYEERIARERRAKRQKEIEERKRVAAELAARAANAEFLLEKWRDGQRRSSGAARAPSRSPRRARSASTDEGPVASREQPETVTRYFYVYYTDANTGPDERPPSNLRVWVSLVRAKTLRKRDWFRYDAAAEKDRLASELTIRTKKWKSPPIMRGFEAHRSDLFATRQEAENARANAIAHKWRDHIVHRVSW